MPLGWGNLVSLLASWIVFPALLAALCLGCGLLLEGVLRSRISGALLAPVGFAAIIVVASLTTISDLTANLTTPAVIGLAAAGFGLAGWNRLQRPDVALLTCAAAVYLVYLAPVALSGDATFAGYIKLDDTATWFAITDHVMEHGRNFTDLAPSTYEATLDAYPGDGYPIGVNLPLGVGRELSGQDVAWVFQPYIAFLAALLAIAVAALVKPLVGRRWLVALVAFLAAQASLLFGYALWGGVKEVAAALLIAAAAALTPAPAAKSPAVRELLPLALVAVALFAVLSLAGGLVWLGSILAITAFLVARSSGLRSAGRSTVLFAGLAACLSIPLLLTTKVLAPTETAVTSEAVLNLLQPLDTLQVIGVWPSGDFRLRPEDLTSARVLAVLTIGSAALGALLAWRAGARPLLLFVTAGAFGALVITLLGSPWISGKALATASPCFLALALAGAAGLISRGRGIEGGVVFTAIAGGVLWSSALAYHDVDLAPRAQLQELKEIGDQIADEGPTLMTEYQPYGARHFLREADPEAASELRFRPVPLRDGQLLPKGKAADTDEFRVSALLEYRTLVLRRSPTQSRPPVPFRLVDSGTYYDVWQQSLEVAPGVIEHLPLGTQLDPGGMPSCEAILRMARLPEARELAAVPLQPGLAVGLDTFERPAAWESDPGSVGTVIPGREGRARTTLRLPTSGTHELWIAGSVRGRLAVAVDGVEVGSVRAQRNGDRQFLFLGETVLNPGNHEVVLEYGGPDLHPSSGGRPFPIGPLVVNVANRDPPVIAVPPSKARMLCGKRFDWIEAVG